MTWKKITTVTLGCGHITYFRDSAAPKIGHIVQCPYCKLGALVKVITTNLKSARLERKFP